MESRTGPGPRGWRAYGLLLVVMALGGAACSSPSEAPPEADPSVSKTAASETATPSAPASETAPQRRNPRFEEWRVPPGTHPHDVAVAPDGRVWFTGQGDGTIGRLDPKTGRITSIDLPSGAAPHGVIVDARGNAWVTDGGLNAIVRVDRRTHRVQVHPLPDASDANLNTATFAGDGTLWFTGQAGVHGRLRPDGTVAVFDSPRGDGPYGIATTPGGDVWLASLAGSYIARVRSAQGQLDVVDVPTAGGGARRVWSDSHGHLWVTEWYAGKLARYDPARERWTEWQLPGDDPQPYAVYVDDVDHVWVT
ncbi:MAG TPA: hypothetical protein VJS45_00590, partial [Acidimicrobiia bacterium]|nr:hypothetical protein [Acidimicrobiia bacterium]